MEEFIKLILEEMKVTYREMRYGLHYEEELSSEYALFFSCERPLGEDFPVGLIWDAKKELGIDLDIVVFVYSKKNGQKNLKFLAHGDPFIGEELMKAYGGITDGRKTWRMYNERGDYGIKKSGVADTSEFDIKEIAENVKIWLKD